MASLSSLTGGVDILSQIRLHNPAGSDPGQLAKAVENDSPDAARAFEALLIHNMLKAMRRTIHTEDPSNGRALYDDMFDQQLAKVLSDRGSLGIAAVIERQLNIQDTNSTDGQTNTNGTHPNAQAAGASAGDYQALVNQIDWAKRLWTGSNNVGTEKKAAQQQSFIRDLLPEAARSAQRLGTTVEAVLAVDALETGWGKHVIKDSAGNDSHNLFGIKAHAQQVNITSQQTTEYEDGVRVKINASFRTYQNRTASISDFADFLIENPRYSEALQQANDPASFLKELQKAGYATDPDYANKAIDVLRQIESLRMGDT